MQYATGPPVSHRSTTSTPATRAPGPPYQSTCPESTPRQQLRAPTGFRLSLPSNRTETAVEKSAPRTRLEKVGATLSRQVQSSPKNLEANQTPVKKFNTNQTPANNFQAKQTAAKPTPVKPTSVKDTPARRELEFGQAGRGVSSNKLKGVSSTNGVAAKQNGATGGKKGASATHVREKMFRLVRPPSLM